MPWLVPFLTWKGLTPPLKLPNYFQFPAAVPPLPPGPSWAQNKQAGKAHWLVVGFYTLAPKQVPPLLGTWCSPSSGDLGVEHPSYSLPFLCGLAIPRGHPR